MLFFTSHSSHCDAAANICVSSSQHSEMYGRRITFIGSYALFAIFQVGCGAAQNLTTLLVCRFFAGLFGASPLVNSGGVIADMFGAAERGIAISVWAVAPFLGPVIGPIVSSTMYSTLSLRLHIDPSSFFFCRLVDT